MAEMIAGFSWLQLLIAWELFVASVAIFCFTLFKADTPRCATITVAALIIIMSPIVAVTIHENVSPGEVPDKTAEVVAEAVYDRDYDTLYKYASLEARAEQGLDREAFIRNVSASLDNSGISEASLEARETEDPLVEHEVDMWGRPEYEGVAMYTVFLSSRGGAEDAIVRVDVSNVDGEYRYGRIAVRDESSAEGGEYTTVVGEGSVR